MGIASGRKVAIVGCGFVGSTTAFSLMGTGLFTEMVLIDMDQDRAEGEALDISHGTVFASPCEIYAGTYADAADADIMIITAGAGQAPGETRIDLAGKNVSIMKSIINEVNDSGFNGILLILSNPVDVLTYAATTLSNLPENHILGSGTVLDTGRLRHLIGAELDVDSRNVHAHVIGEHGDSEFIAWSGAHVAGIPLEDFFHMRTDHSFETFRNETSADVRDAAYEIIAKKKATYYGIAMAAARICMAIVRDEKSVLAVSHVLHGEYSIEGVALSMPCIIGSQGIECSMPPVLNYQEQQALRKSADTLRSVIEDVGLE